MSVQVEQARLRVGERLVPLISGEVHFWRIDPSSWDPILDRMVAAGIPILATYLSWRRHEPAPGSIDLRGISDPRLDLRAFLDRCQARGLLVHLKPGPWICAEEPNGGYPDWLLADPDILALDATDRPIIGYEAPWQHPVPSYLHPRYLTHVRRWLRAVDATIRDLIAPEGPLALVQLDNEPSYAFRDGMYEADYHPLVLHRFRGWVLRRHGGLRNIGLAWRTPIASVEAIEPPRGPEQGADVPGSGPYRRAHDWVDFRTWLLGEHLRRLRKMHERAGIRGVLYTANYNEHVVETIPQDPVALRRVVRGIAGEDLYFEPPIGAEDVIRLARTLALARAAREPLRWAPEIQAGIWRAPGREPRHRDPTPQEQAFWLLAAIAFGLQGMNLYMLADREHWDLAPLDRAGRPGAFWPPIERAVQTLRTLVESGGGLPASRVAVLVERDRLRDAFVSLGAGATLGRDVTQPWMTSFGQLVAAGHVPTLWHGDDAPEPGVAALVRPAGPTGIASQSAVEQRVAAFRQIGGSVVDLPDAITGSELGELLRQAGLEPPVWIDGADALACLHEGGGRPVVFLVYWGAATMTATLRFADRRVDAMLLPMCDGRETVTVSAGVATVRLTPRSVTSFGVVQRPTARI